MESTEGKVEIPLATPVPEQLKTSFRKVFLEESFDSIGTLSKTPRVISKAFWKVVQTRGFRNPTREGYRYHGVKYELRYTPSRLQCCGYPIGSHHWKVFRYQ